MDANAFFDVIVVGGGPAGLMAAGQAATRGLKTLLLEKMDVPGKKLCITGMKRCNLTNTANLDEFIAHFGKNGKFLRQAFNQFFSADLTNFIEILGIQTTVERGGRIFPSDGDATAVAEKLIYWAAQCGVKIQANSPVDAVTVIDGASASAGAGQNRR